MSSATSASIRSADRSPAALFAFASLFFVSGFAALIYQVVWQRLLTLYYGVGAISTAIVVSAFLAGMGFGGLLGGRIAESIRRRIIAYVAIELIIGAFGLASIGLLEAIGKATAGAEYPVVLAISFAFLLLPTFLMGTTLPLLVRICAGFEGDFYRNVSRLYFANTLGAAAGTAIAAYVFISFWGLDGAVTIAAFLNLCLAFGLLMLRHRISDGSVPANLPAGAPPASATATSAGFRPAFYLVIAVVVGFLAIGYEIVWFRVVSAIVKNSAYSFASVLAMYLLGIALGSLWGPKLVARHPGRQREFFFLLNAAVGISALATMLLFYYGFQVPPLRSLGEAAGALEPHPYVTHGEVTAREALKMAVSWAGLFGYPLLFVLLPTFFMGASFPLMTSLAYRGRHPALTTGRVYSCSTLGNVAGGLLTTFVLFPLLGTERTLLLFALTGIAFLLLAEIPGKLTGALSRRVVLAVALASVGASLMPGPGQFYHFVFELLRRSPIRDFETFDREGPDGQSTIYVKGEELYNTVNGVWHGIRPSPAFYAHVFAGLSRLNSAEKVMMIGIGAASYVEASQADARVRRITVVELSDTMVRNFRNVPRIQRLIDDPRTEMIVDDGRRMLFRRNEKWDLILMNPTRRQFAYAGNLYSYDFYALITRHLTPTGVLLVKSQGDIQARTVAAAFPFVEELPCGVLAASLERKHFSEEQRQRLLAALPEKFRAEVEAVDCKPFRDRERILAETGHLPVATDLRPYGEYFLAVERSKPRD